MTLKHTSGPHPATSTAISTSPAAGFYPEANESWEMPPRPVLTPQPASTDNWEMIVILVPHTCCHLFVLVSRCHLRLRWLQCTVNCLT